MDMIKAVSDFIFVNDELKHSDIIFIPGCSQSLIGEKAAQLWKDGYAPLIMPSGRYALSRESFGGPDLKRDIYNKAYETEAEMFEDILVRNGVDKSAIIKEEQARVTRDNALFSRKLCDSLSLKINKAIIIAKSFHTRRALMYYQIYFPQTDFYVSALDSNNLSKDNWFTTENGRKRVFKEVNFIGKYVIDEYAKANIK